MSSSEQVLKIALGATSLYSPLTGIGNYTLHLATALTEDLNQDIEYFYGYSWSDQLQVVNAPKASKVKKLIRKLIPHAYIARRTAQQYAFSSESKNNHFDLYHEPNFIPMNFDGPTVITVHDLSYIRFPEAHPVERVKMMSKMLPPAIERADAIIADSHFTKSELMDEFGVLSEKIHVTHLGLSPDFYPRQQLEVAKVAMKYKLKANEYFIAVGTIEPRKNLVQAIQAYRALPDDLAKRYPLAIVGMRGWKEKGLLSELNNLVIQGKAKLLGYVDADDLPVLYSGARGLVFPSLYEGFGLPVLEAMACGTPVIASNSSSIPEVIGDAGMLVEVGDVDGLKECIEKLCFDEDEFSRMSKAGVIQAQKFSWKKCAEQTYAAYLYAIASK
jgi:glycosyltransferase involved in cell wall biosynthesis